MEQQWWWNTLSFNKKYHWPTEEKRFLQQQLSFLAPVCRDGIVIVMTKPLHYSKNDLLPHYTFSLWDPVNDKRIFDESRKKQFHLYMYQGRMIRLMTFFDNIPSVVDFPM